MRVPSEWLDMCPDSEDLDTGSVSLVPTEEWIFRIQADARRDLEEKIKRLEGTDE